MDQHRIKIDKNAASTRLDEAIFTAKLGFSRRNIRDMIGIGAVYLNRKRIKVAARPVKGGDQIDIEFDPRSLELKDAVQSALNDAAILYDELDIVAINKPPGIPAQATRHQDVFHVQSCLQNWYQRSSKPISNLWVVHRLDKETSGIMLVAKSQKAADFLSQEFKDKKIEKTYHALVHGIMSSDEQVVTLPLAAINGVGLVKVDEKQGREAITKISVIARYPASGITLVACAPQTGRTHQIRVHLAALDLPIVGDKKYYPAKIRELTPDLREIASWHHLLHAAAVKFRPARGLPAQTLKASYPENFAKFLAAIAKPS